MALSVIMMAECLVPEMIPPPELLQEVYVPTHDAASKLNDLLHQHSITSVKVIPEPNMFFQPSLRSQLTTKLSLVEGDLFFSMMQTLTVSVNCVGVMGKGLASRAKHQFPDVYVEYQDLCRKRRLALGKPVLYKREASLDYALADEPGSMVNGNAETWFLLFPTKGHWREQADIEGIRKGLEWLQDAYKSEGIKTLAIPALGCGLGRLDWRDVGPLMCQKLVTLDIPVALYLPAEKKIHDELLTKDFLLG